MVKLDLGAIPIREKVTIKIPKRPAWYKASKENIMSNTEELDCRIQDILVPDSAHCLDTECSDPSHSIERDSMVLDILVNIIEVSHSKIPMVGGKTEKTGDREKPGSIPGWKEDDARFWHSLLVHGQ